MNARVSELLALLSMGDRKSRAEGAVSVYRGRPPAESILSSDERPLLIREGQERVAVVWVVGIPGSLHLILRGPNVTNPYSA